MNSNDHGFMKTSGLLQSNDCQADFKPKQDSSLEWTYSNAYQTKTNTEPPKTMGGTKTINHLTTALERTTA